MSRWEHFRSDVCDCRFCQVRGDAGSDPGRGGDNWSTPGAGGRGWRDVPHHRHGLNHALLFQAASQRTPVHIPCPFDFHGDPRYSSGAHYHGNKVQNDELPGKYHLLGNNWGRLQPHVQAAPVISSQQWSLQHRLAPTTICSGRTGQIPSS